MKKRFYENDLEKALEDQKIVEFGKNISQQIDQLGKTIQPTTIIQLPPTNSYGGPALIPFSVLKQKQTENVLKRQVLQQLEISNSLNRELLFTLRGGFVLGGALKVLKNLFKLAKKGKEILEEENKKQELFPFPKKQNDNQIKEILDKLSKILPFLIVLRFLYPKVKMEDVIPTQVGKIIGLPPKKELSILQKVGKIATDFKHPLPYFLILASLIFLVMLVRYYSPQSPLTLLVSNAFQTLTKSYTDFLNYMKKMNEENMRQIANQSKEALAETKKNLNQCNSNLLKIDQQNNEIRNQNTVLDKQITKAVTALEECTNSLEVRENFIYGHAEVQKTWNNYQKALESSQNQPAISPTADGENTTGKSTTGGK